MPAYKSQHFLPVAYLREFTSDKTRTDRKAPLWRFDGNRSHSVPVESQCVKDYHYSRRRAAFAESIFCGMECFYSKCIQTVKKGTQPKRKEFLGLILMMFDLRACLKKE